MTDITHGERAGDPWVDRLSEYVDGDLAGAERAALEAHLATCDACAAALEDLRAVVSQAHALIDTPPAQDLWPGIAAQIAAESAAPERAAPAPVVTHRAWWTRRFEFGVPQLAAAGVLLVALTAGAVWLVTQGNAPTTTPGGARPNPIATRPGPFTSPAAIPGPEGGVQATPATAGSAPSAAAVPAIMSNPGYDATIASLEQALAEGQGRLDPKTLRIIERNLRIIDQALAEARQAVIADPNNTWLQSHLAATMKRKVDLLRTATLLTAAHG